MKRVPPEERMERLLRENKRLRCELAWITAQRNRFEKACSTEGRGEARKFWGLTVTKPKHLGGTLLDETWNSMTDEPRWGGEPNWPLLFRTRRQAVEWKRNAEAEYRRLGWKFRVVRVQMTVEEVP